MAAEEERVGSKVGVKVENLWIARRYRRTICYRYTDTDSGFRNTDRNNGLFPLCSE